MEKGCLQYLPVGLFGSTVAMSSLSIAWNQATVLFGAPSIPAVVIGILAWAMFILLALFYLIKIIRYPVKVKEELMHPVTAHFFGTFFISAVLLAIVSIPFSLPLARILWMAGTTGGLVFLCVLTARLYQGQLSAPDAAPPVLIPGLTVLNAVNAGAGMQFGRWGNEVDSMLFSFGIVYVFLFFIIITYRLVHGGAISLFLEPTLLLMSAPFEVGFLAYLRPSMQIDTFASVIFFFGLFIFFVLFFKIFKKGLPFMITWWTACFSIVALTNAALRFACESHNIPVIYIAGILLLSSSLLISVTFILTIRLQLREGLLRP